MKNIKKNICSVILAVMLLLVLSGCGAANSWESMEKIALKMQAAVEDVQLRQNTEQMLGYILADDYKNAHTMVCQVVSETDFRQYYDQFRTELSGVTEYELIASHKNINIANGIKTITIRYMLTSGEKNILVESACTDSYIGLTGFRVYTYEPVTQTGTLFTMGQANGTQWVLLVIGLLEAAFVVWMFVDCCCHKMRKKWLWLLLILLGAIAISFTVDSGIHYRYNIGLFFNLYTALIRFSTGGGTLRLMFPVGAVLYLSFRKKLIQQPKQEELPLDAEEPVLER